MVQRGRDLSTNPVLVVVFFPPPSFPLSCSLSVPLPLRSATNTHHPALRSGKASAGVTDDKQICVSGMETEVCMSAVRCDVQQPDLRCLPLTTKPFLDVMTHTDILPPTPTCWSSTCGRFTAAHFMRAHTHPHAHEINSCLFL